MTVPSALSPERCTAAMADAGPLAPACRRQDPGVPAPFTPTGVLEAPGPAAGILISTMPSFEIEGRVAVLANPPEWSRPSAYRRWRIRLGWRRFNVPAQRAARETDTSSASPAPPPESTGGICGAVRRTMLMLGVRASYGGSPVYCLSDLPAAFGGWPSTWSASVMASCCSSRSAASGPLLPARRDVGICSRTGTLFPCETSAVSAAINRPCTSASEAEGGRAGGGAAAGDAGGVAQARGPGRRVGKAPARQAPASSSPRAAVSWSSLVPASGAGGGGVARPAGGGVAGGCCRRRCSWRGVGGAAAGAGARGGAAAAPGFGRRAVHTAEISAAE